MQHTVYLALGTNLGDKENNILEAYRLIEKNVGRIISRSTLHHTEPWGFTSQNEFVNSAIKCSTPLSPQELLKTTQEIETKMGRTMKSECGEYHDRIIDIDILLYDNIRIDEPDLHIPHPLMRERTFVMMPLSEIMDIKDIQNDKTL